MHLGSFNLYADDTLIYCTGSNIVELKTNIQKCVTDVHEWYESNKIVINTSKSNVMLLTTRQMLSHMTDTDLNVHIGNHELLQCNLIKYLGVDIDNVLSWDIQTDNISKKLVFIISRLSGLKPVLRRDDFMIMLMFKSIYGLVPNYLCDEITMQRDIAERTTRSTIDNNVHVPHITLECQNAFAYSGPV